MVRVSVLCDSQLKTYQVEAIEYMIDNADVDISLVVVNRSSSSGQKHSDQEIVRLLRSFRCIFRRRRWWILVQIERWVSEQLGLRTRSSRYQGTVDVEEIEILENVEAIECSPILVGEGPWKELPDNVVKRVAKESDVAIRFGFGLLQGDILSAPEYGVLSFHPADIREIRGLGTSVAFLQNHETVGMTLQRLDETVDSGEVVSTAKVDVSRRDTLEEILIKQRKTQRFLLTEAMADLTDGSLETVVPEELGDYYTVEKRESFLFAGAIAFKNFIRRLINHR